MVLFGNCPQGRHLGKLRAKRYSMQNQAKTAVLPPMACGTPCPFKYLLPSLFNS